MEAKMLSDLIKVGTYHPNKKPEKEKISDDERVIQLKELFDIEIKRWSNKWKKPFTIDEENKEVLMALLLYFSQSPLFEKLEWNENSGMLRNKPLLSKSLLLFGNVGSGKTLMFQLFNNCFEPSDQARVVPCDVITDKIRKEGIVGISSFVAAIREGGIKNEILFDDLGLDSKGKFYGDEINPMFDIIMKRYRLFTQQGLKTHFTTNANTMQLREIYDTRTESRLSEMSNYIILGGSATSKDRRKSTLF